MKFEKSQIPRSIAEDVASYYIWFNGQVMKILTKLQIGYLQMNLKKQKKQLKNFISNIQISQDHITSQISPNSLIFIRFQLVCIHMGKLLFIAPYEFFIAFYHFLQIVNFGFQLLHIFTSCVVSELELSILVIHLYLFFLPFCFCTNQFVIPLFKCFYLSFELNNPSILGRNQVSESFDLTLDRIWIRGFQIWKGCLVERIFFSGTRFRFRWLWRIRLVGSYWRSRRNQFRNRLISYYILKRALFSMNPCTRLTCLPIERFPRNRLVGMVANPIEFLTVHAIISTTVRLAGKGRYRMKNL
jgi:hypothetical protein